MTTDLPVMVAASAPRFCLLCRGRQAAQLLGPGGIGLPVACPHCTPGGPADTGQPLPILSVPFRTDTPVESTP